MLADSGYKCEKEDYVITPFKNVDKMNENKRKKACYWNKIHTSNRFIVENVFSRLISLFRFFNTIPEYQNDFLETLYSFGFCILNFNILKHPLRRVNSINDVILSQDSIDVFFQFEEYFSKYKYFNENRKDVEEMDSLLKKLNEMVNQHEYKIGELRNDLPLPLRLGYENEKEMFETIIKKAPGKDNSGNILFHTKTLVFEDLNMNRIKNGRMLDDICVMFWSHYIQEKYPRKDVLVVDSYSFEYFQMTEKGRKENYMVKLKRRLSDNDEIKLFLFPRHFDNHWVLYAFDYREEKMMEEENSLTNKIIFMNSLPDMNPVIEDDSKCIKEFIMMYFDLRNAFMNAYIPFVKLNVPEQPKGSIECGVYVCYFLQQIVMKRPILENEWKSSELFKKDECSIHRERMVELLENYILESK